MDPKNSTIIINANILTMDEHLNAYPNGFVKITDGLIEAVGEDFQGSPEQYENLLDAKGGIVIPGMINCHTMRPCLCSGALAMMNRTVCIVTFTLLKKNMSLLSSSD